MQLDPGRIASDSDSGRFATSACDAGVDRNRWRALDPSLVMQDTHTQREREGERQRQTDRQTEIQKFTLLRYAMQEIALRIDLLRICLCVSFVFSCHVKL